MNYKKQIAQKTEQEQPLKFSQLIARTIIFTGIFIFIWFLTTKVFGISDEYYFLSEMPITDTWVIGFVIIFLTWFIYLIFIAKDNTLRKLWKTVEPVTSHSNSKSLKWWLFIFMVVLNLYFTFPSIYSNINAFQHQLLFKGKVTIHEGKKNGDERFLNLYIISDNNQYTFEGNSEEINPLLNKKVEISIYQGIFTKYALIKK